MGFRSGAFELRNQGPEFRKQNYQIRDLGSFLIRSFSMSKDNINEGRIVPSGLVFILLLIFAPYFDGALSSMTRHKASSLRLP